jgi:hypothetical protein
MRLWALAVASLLLTCARAERGIAQPSALAIPSDAPGLVLPAAGSDTASPFLLPPTRETSSPWSVDLLLGLPTGVRAQCVLDADGDRVWLAEGVVGFELIMPLVGGGVRRRFTAPCGEYDALILSPGMGVYLLINPLADNDFFGGPPVAGLVAADVDFVWRHAYPGGWDGRLGLKLGAGAGYGSSWGIGPVVSVFAGWQF